MLGFGSTEVCPLMSRFSDPAPAPGTPSPDHRVHALEFRNVGKTYGPIAALNSLSLTVERGTIHGFLGPNGAGKTTAIRILMGFLKASSGTCRIFGLDPWREGVEARRRVGYLVTADALYPDMSGNDQLAFAAEISGGAPALRGRVLDALELSADALGRRLGTYSKGMRQKLAITAAMQHDPELLVLDEPSDGLDPLVQQRLEELLRERQVAGRTVFMSSHDLAEVERVCQRVAVIRNGALVADGSTRDLSRQYQRTAVITFRGTIPDRIEEAGHVIAIDRDRCVVEIRVGDDINVLIRRLAREEVDSLTIREPQLQDVFFSYYGDAGENAQTEPVSSGASQR